MVKGKFILAAGVVLIIGGVVCYLILQSDTAKIKRQLKTLSTNFDKEPGETNLTAGIKAKNIKELFSNQLVLEIPSHDISRTFDRKDIPSYVMTGRMYFKSILLKFYDISVDFPDSGEALVTLTARLTGEMNSREMMDEIQELECSAVKKEDNWLFDSIKTIVVLEK